MSRNEILVPFVDLGTPHREMSQEILRAWKAILERAGFIGGPEVSSFEEEFARFQGTRHCVGVGSGTDALRLLFVALGIRDGDEVITVPHTFIATTEAITQAGARPVFVDVERSTGTMDPARVASAITARTRLILPVHLYGQIADMNPILEIASRHGIPVAEDAAQAHGAEYHGVRAGTFGIAAAFSFFPSKNLGACGDGGAVVTDDEDLATRIRMLRDHGQARKHYHEFEGYNSRLDAIQAAALRIKLRRLADWNAQRREVARLYAEMLGSSGLELPREMEERSHVYHLYVVRHRRRDEIRESLARAGIETGLHYPIPLHLQQAYRGLGHRLGDFPESERWAARGLSLPMFAGMARAQVEQVCRAVIDLGLDPG